MDAGPADRARRGWTRAIHPALVVVHRYVGLAIATFLLVAGITGSVSVFKRELDALVNPGLFRVRPPSPDARPLDPMVLRGLVEPQLPAGVHLWEVSLLPIRPGDTQGYTLSWDGEGEAPMSEAFADPYTGRLIGGRRWADPGEGLVNLVPFIYRLHISLALGEVGAWLLGIVAVLWTVDCFIGLYLTFPARRAAPSSGGVPWLRRWRPSWMVRGGSLFGAIFTFHRASGLWAWPLLLLFAWSSVGILMRPVYDPVMSLVFTSYDYTPLRPLDHPRFHPRLTWEQALARGRELMAAEAAQRGFTIVRPFLISHEPDWGFYRYQVESSLDPATVWCDTTVRMDSDTGELVNFDAPTGGEAGRSFSTWLLFLHFGWVGGIAFRILICLVGIVTAALCVTGVVIWWRKLRLRRAAKRRAPQAG